MRLLSVGLILSALSGCMSLPKVEWCILNGDGSGQCRLPGAAEPVTKMPPQLENYICSNPKDMEKLINACKGPK